MLTVTGCFLLMLFGHSMSASNRRCLPLYEGGSFCFTQPDPPVNLSWSSAIQWCKNIGATLPILNSSYHGSVYENALAYFGLQAETLWLGANSTYDPDKWFWTDGSNFTGKIELSNSSYQSHAYIMRNGSVIKLFANNMYENNYYICRGSYSELSCAASSETCWINGKCYIKYSSAWSRMSWYSFVSNCGQSNIPSYDDLKELSRWLDNLVKYWIGLRCGWWTWQDMVTGRSFEIFQNMAGGNLPNIGYGECLASYRNGSSNWINLDCSRTLQFVCQEHLIETGTKRSEATWPKDYFNNDLPTKAPVFDPQLTGVFIAIGAWLGGMLSLAVTICLMRRAVNALKRNRDARYSPIDLPKLSENNPTPTSCNAYDNYTFNVSVRNIGEDVITQPLPTS